jgi:hypothetical protein
LAALPAFIKPHHIQSFTMKSILLFAITCLYITTGFAQNVGVGQASPVMKIHVAHTDSSLALFENTQALGIAVKDGLFFKTGDWFTGGLATIGTGPNSSRVSILGYAYPDPSGLREYLSVLDNGYVGIGTSTPSSLLEVNGDIDVTGTIKAQGVAGTPGQVLRTADNGDLIWGQIAESQYPPS